MFSYVLWARRRGVIGWSIGIALLALLTMAFFPAVTRDAEAFAKMVSMLPRALLAMFGVDDPASMLTAVGFVSARIYASLGAALLLIFGIGAGAWAIAGAEEAGELEIICSQPISRPRIIGEAAAGLAVMLAVPIALLAVVVAITNAVVGLGITAAGIAAANVGLFLVAYLYALVALAAGALTGRRGASIGITAALAGSAFFIQGLAPLVESLRFAQKLSPFHWFLGGNPLAAGFSSSFALLALAAAAMLGVAIWGFGRRDIGV
jgi:ABC-2 type transport system permease protein